MFKGSILDTPMEPGESSATETPIIIAKGFDESEPSENSIEFKYREAGGTIKKQVKYLVDVESSFKNNISPQDACTLALTIRNLVEFYLERCG